MDPIRLYLLEPTVIFRARVNQASFTYPLAEVGFDTVTTGSYTAILEGMTVKFGTTLGGDDLGRSRVRKAATSTTLYFGRSSEGVYPGEVSLTDNAYIEVVWLYEVWAKVPYIAPDGTAYKDHDIPVGDRMDYPPPVANPGTPCAGTIDPDTGVLRLTFPESANTSFATADGATITDYLWGLDGGSTLVSGYTLADDQIQVDFAPGFHYLSLTVTDSNGQTHKARTFVYARDPDADTSIEHFQITEHTLTRAGQRMSVRVLDAIPASQYPEGTIALVWEGEPFDPTGRSHMLFAGWVGTEPVEIGATRTGTVAGVTLNLLDVGGKLAQLPGFSQEIEYDSTPGKWWEMDAPNLDKFLHYLLHWHSTALEVAEFTWSGIGSSAQFRRLQADGDTLWDQADGVARAYTPDYVLTCDKWGRLGVKVDPLIQDVADRDPDPATVIDADEWTDLAYVGQRHPRVYWLNGSAVEATLTLNAQDETNTFFCVAPGSAPGQGTQEQAIGNKLAPTQDALNRAIGHHYARLNAPQSKFRVRLPYGPSTTPTWRFIDPAELRFVQLTLPATVAAQRGLSFTTENGLPESLSIRYEYTPGGVARGAEMVWERATAGKPALTVIKPGVPAAGTPQTPSAETPDSGLTAGQNQVAGIAQEGGTGFLYVTSNFQTASGSGGPTWTRKATTATDTFLAFVVDPFSSGYVGTGTTVNGWAVGKEKIWHITDIFGTTPAVTAVHTFGTSIAGAGSAMRTRTIQASFGTGYGTGGDPWLMVVSHYADTGGHTGTWATSSRDAGVTWSDEVEITPHYNNGSTGATNTPPGLYLSSRTPGYALAFAYSETASPARAAAYASYDWGATWGLVAGDENPAEPLPLLAVVDNTGTVIQEALTTNLTVEVNAAITTSSTNNSGNHYLIVAPPSNAKKITIAGSYANAFNASNPGGSGKSATITQQQSIFSPNEVSDLSFTAAAWNSTSSGTFTTTWTRGVGQTSWAGNRTAWLAGTHTTANYCRAQVYIGVSGLTNQTTNGTLSVTYRVTEIELDDNTVYTPTLPAVLDSGHHLAGALHVPWTDNNSEAIVYWGKLDATGNLAYTLQRRESDGTTVTDVSPVLSGRTYGCAGLNFAVRAYDSDRQVVAVAATGNGTTAAVSGNQHAVFVSGDAGATWTHRVGAQANGTFSGLVPGYRVAFSGTDPDVLYVWGAPPITGSAPYAIAYSTNGGVTLDDRSGNLDSSYGDADGKPVTFIAICGGPT